MYSRPTSLLISTKLTGFPTFSLTSALISRILLRYCGSSLATAGAGGATGDGIGCGGVTTGGIKAGCGGDTTSAAGIWTRGGTGAAIGAGCQAGAAVKFGAATTG